MSVDHLAVIDLDAMRKPVGRVRVCGAEHDVMPANGVAADLLQQIAARQSNGVPGAGADFLELARLIVAEAVPTLSAEDRGRLDHDQLGAIIGISTRQVEAVRAMIDATEKNGSGPAVEVPPAPKAAPAASAGGKGQQGRKFIAR